MREARAKVTCCVLPQTGNIQGCGIHGLGWGRESGVPFGEEDGLEFERVVAQPWDHYVLSKRLILCYVSLTST